MIRIDPSLCIACKACIKDCPTDDIELEADFARAKNAICLHCGHCIAICPARAVRDDSYDMSEALEYDPETFSLPPENLLNFIKFRRSVRRFQNRTIESEKLERILEAGRFSPTGSNRQSVSYIVLEKDIPSFRLLALKSLAESSQAILDTQKSLSPTASFAAKWKRLYELEQTSPGREDALFFHAPAVVLLVSDSAVDAALAASNMELMAFAEGLGALYCGFFCRAGQSSTEIQSLLELPPSQNIQVCMPLGYPDVRYFRTVPRNKPNIRWR